MTGEFFFQGHPWPPQNRPKGILPQWESKGILLQCHLTPSCQEIRPLLSANLQPPADVCAYIPLIRPSVYCQKYRNGLIRGRNDLAKKPRSSSQLGPSGPFATGFLPGMTDLTNSVLFSCFFCNWKHKDCIEYASLNVIIKITWHRSIIHKTRRVNIKNSSIVVWLCFVSYFTYHYHIMRVPMDGIEGLVELEVLNLSGECMLTLDVADAMLGREFLKMMLDKLPVKPGPSAGVIPQYCHTCAA